MRRRHDWTLAVSYVGCVGALAAAAGLAQQQAERAPLAQPAAADKAPGFELPDLDGNAVSLEDLRGEEENRVVVLEWFDPRCDWVRSNYGDSSAMRDLYNEFHPSGVEWVSIYSSTPPEDMKPEEINRQAAEEWNIEHPILIDGDRSVAKLYSVRLAPYVVVISSDGEIAYAGAIDDSREPGQPGAHSHLRSALEALRDGRRPIPARTTSSAGCDLTSIAPGD